MVDASYVFYGVYNNCRSEGFTNLLYIKYEVLPEDLFTGGLNLFR